MRTAIFILLCFFILVVSTADLITGLGLAAYWVALLMPGQLILSIYDTFNRYYVVLAIFAIIGAIAGFVGIIVECWRKFSKWDTTSNPIAVVLRKASSIWVVHSRGTKWLKTTRSKFETRTTWRLHNYDNPTVQRNTSKPRTAAFLWREVENRGQWMVQEGQTNLPLRAMRLRLHGPGYRWTMRTTLLFRKLFDPEKSDL